MVNANLLEYADKNWKAFLKPISDLSKPCSKEKSLVECDKMQYSFDAIYKSFGVKHPLCSADAIEISQNEIVLIEYKTGFKDKMKVQLDPKLAVCDKISGNKVECTDVFDALASVRKKDKELLKQSIKTKAIDSWTILEKMIFPKCSCKNEVKVVYSVVVDVNPPDGEMAIMEKMSKQDSGSQLSAIKDSLKKYILTSDDGDNLLFDDIKVYSSNEYQSIINL